MTNTELVDLIFPALSEFQKACVHVYLAAHQLDYSAANLKVAVIVVRRDVR